MQGTLSRRKPDATTSTLGTPQPHGLQSANLAPAFADKSRSVFAPLKQSRDCKSLSGYGGEPDHLRMKRFQHGLVDSPYCADSRLRPGKRDPFSRQLESGLDQLRIDMALQKSRVNPPARATASFFASTALLDFLSSNQSRLDHLKQEAEKCTFESRLLDLKQSFQTQNAP